MREILFRGKNIKTGEWEIGDLVYMFGKVPYIHKSYGEAEIYREVDPRTIGQYVETNFEGYQLFEGDLVKFPSTSSKMIGTIIWGAVAFWIIYNDAQYNVDADEIQCYSLVGNKWDNPELYGNMEAE